ncbi:MAG: FtsW/RodA/SpoVE family cell cycle protein [Flavobacteriales bacterium]|nr:FtsW/RodA/SpoVE family cell cycle protein [Flavobacteriales bacterium]
MIPILERLRIYLKGDPVIWLVVALLSLFGILAVYSSTGTLGYVKQSGNTEFYVIRHITILVVSLVIMWLVHLIDFRFYSRPAQLLVYPAMLLLAYTLVFGANINAASRWVYVPGTSLSFQPSDLAKVAILLYIARFLSKQQEKIRSFRKSFLPVLLHIVAVCGLIAPADLSTASVLFATCLLVLFIGRIPVRYLLALSGAGVLGLTLMIVIILNLNVQGRVGTWKERIEDYIEFAQGKSTEESYQNQQAKIAIAKGGLLGVGPGKSTQRNFLPSPYADFIFAIIIEEYGMIGAVVLISVYLLLLWRTVQIVIRTPKAFGAFLAIGLSFSLVIQAFINMGVAVHLFPVTGLPMPLVSMGGTSLLFTSIALGIILSVSREKNEYETNEEA